MTSFFSFKMIDNKDLIFRSATFQDASFIAKVVLSAIGRYDFKENDAEIAVILQSTEAICAMEDSLYSYRNAHIAEYNGEIIGGIVAYDGADYSTMREKTFRIIKERNGIDLDDSDMETEAGEFYVDSLAVVPSWRGNDFGKQMLIDIEQHARKKGASLLTLIVDVTHPKVKDYYTSLGFEVTEEMNAFGASFFKMKKQV